MTNFDLNYLKAKHCTGDDLETMPITMVSMIMAMSQQVEFVKNFIWTSLSIL